MKPKNFIVVNQKYVEEGLNDAEKQAFYCYLDKITANTNAKTKSYYVINVNEPYADAVIKLIEANENLKEHKAKMTQCFEDFSKAIENFCKETTNASK